MLLVVTKRWREGDIKDQSCREIRVLAQHIILIASEAEFMTSCHDITFFWMMI